MNAAQLQTKLAGLMEQYSGSVEMPPSGVYTSTCHEQLTRQNVIDGVVLMSRFLGMAGSAGDVDLYRLNLAYMLDPAIRLRLNGLCENGNSEPNATSG